MIFERKINSNAILKLLIFIMLLKLAFQGSIGRTLIIFFFNIEQILFFLYSENYVANFVRHITKSSDTKLSKVASHLSTVFFLFVFHFFKD